MEKQESTTAASAAMKRELAITELAKESGFDADGLAYTEFSLVPFFDAIVEKCAKAAELSARNVSGEDNEGAGCHRAASAVRVFGKRFGNHEK